ncbi:MAG: hypothetical protein JNK82_01805, partial [Myxococcaceae bacterium]|nr:hypothetical protein [Myxococcaceae bacterium]
MKKNILLTGALAALLALTGCNTPGLVDKTQPEYTKKADLLDGQWYYKNTIVGSPNTAVRTRVAFGGQLEKIRWEIQEKLLVGYRTYEPVPGRDPRIDLEKSRIGATKFRDGSPYKGTPVVAYAIESHFDRQRRYNPATGEQTNVLVEDAQDRPWYQREFMRVDWASNVLQNTEQCDGAGSGDAVGSCFGVENQRIRYITKQDAVQRDNAPVEERAADGSLQYFDFTTQVIGDPATFYYPGYGRLPYCYISATFDCESSDFYLRTSFKR